MKGLLSWPDAQHGGRRAGGGVGHAVFIHGYRPDKRGGRGEQIGQARTLAQMAVAGDGYALRRAFFEFLHLRLRPEVGALRGQRPGKSERTRALKARDATEAGNGRRREVVRRKAHMLRLSLLELGAGGSIRIGGSLKGTGIYGLRKNSAESRATAEASGAKDLSVNWFLKYRRSPDRLYWRRPRRQKQCGGSGDPHYSRPGGRRYLFAERFPQPV